jgi:hypothetical protein
VDGIAGMEEQFDAVNGLRPDDRIRCRKQRLAPGFILEDGEKCTALFLRDVL